MANPRRMQWRYPSKAGVYRPCLTAGLTAELVTKGRGYQTGYQGISGFQEAGFQGCFHGKRLPAAVNKALVNSEVNTQSRGTQRGGTQAGTQAGTHGKHPHALSAILGRVADTRPMPRRFSAHAHQPEVAKGSQQVARSSQEVASRSSSRNKTTKRRNSKWRPRTKTRQNATEHDKEKGRFEIQPLRSKPGTNWI